MDLHTGLKGTALASCLVLCGAGCAMSAVPAPNDAGSSASGGDPAKAAPAPAPVDEFEGDWYYGSDCDFGHYVSLGLKRSRAGYEGEWSDGTRVRGSQGNLKAVLHNGELIVQRCDDGTDVGGAPDCPAFGPPHDVFARKGESLVWSKRYDGERQPYVTLHRADKKVGPMGECMDDSSVEHKE